MSFTEDVGFVAGCAQSPLILFRVCMFLHGSMRFAGLFRDHNKGNGQISDFCSLQVPLRSPGMSHSMYVNPTILYPIRACRRWQRVSVP